MSAPARTGPSHPSSTEYTRHLRSPGAFRPKLACRAPTLGRRPAWARPWGRRVFDRAVMARYVVTDSWPVTGVPGSVACSRGPSRPARQSRERKRVAMGVRPAPPKGMNASGFSTKRYLGSQPEAESCAGAKNGDCRQFAPHHRPRNKGLSLKRIGWLYPIFRDLHFYHGLLGR